MELIFFVLFILFFVCFMYFIFKLLNTQLSRVFTENYAVLKQQYPFPIHSWKFLSGCLTTKSIFCFWFRGMLKVDVYPDMLIVSSMGQGVCLRYDKYTFHKKQLLFNDLVIENLPVHKKNSFSPVIGPIDFGKFTTLKISLSAKKIDTILKLAQDK